MAKRIKLMAGYNSTPLWWTEDAYSNVDLEDLPLTSETKARLARWADKYDTTLIGGSRIVRFFFG
jgi:hypothetical protein